MLFKPQVTFFFSNNKHFKAGVNLKIHTCKARYTNIFKKKIVGRMTSATLRLNVEVIDL